MPDGLGVLLYYAWLALGSVSIGYLVLRVTVPEVRVRPPEEKLGASVVLGVLAMLTAMLLDGLLYGWGRFSLAQGFTASLAVLSTSLSFVFLKAYVILFPPEFLEVGVPLPSTPLVPSEERAAPAGGAIEEPRVEKL